MIRHRLSLNGSLATLAVASVVLAACDTGTACAVSAPAPAPRPPAPVAPAPRAPAPAPPAARPAAPAPRPASTQVTPPRPQQTAPLRAPRAQETAAPRRLARPPADGRGQVVRERPEGLPPAAEGLIWYALFDEAGDVLEYVLVSEEELEVEEPAAAVVEGC